MLRLALVCALLLACGDDDTRSPLDAGAGADAPAVDAPSLDAPSAPDAPGPTDDAALDAGEVDGGAAPCERALAAADRRRFVVIGHPFPEGGGDGTDYEVLALEEDGTLTLLDRHFDMGTGSDGEIAFTPDGAMGFVAQKDGSLGVFQLDAEGVPAVVHARFSDGFYASGVVADPAGTHVYVLDAQFRESGGGIYELPVNCDGTLGRARLLAPGRLPYGLRLTGSRAGVAFAKDLLDASLGDEAHEVDLNDPATRTRSTNGFDDDDWIGAGFALSPDQGFAFLGDNSAFGGGNRVAVVELGVGPAQPAVVVEDPVALVASPFGDRVLHVSGFGDAAFVSTFDPVADPPMGPPIELSYAGSRPALPGAAVMVDRGTLRGLVLLAENVSVRRIQFAPGEVTDLGATPVGEGVPAVVGAIGIPR